MKEAAEFAESTQILMNVSEFTDVSQATDTLISAVQAFGYTAETSMDVVDLLNTIGNNYAISTADLAKSLTKSSASLVAAGGNLAEAAALTATANAIIQDADSVGTALKTTSLRLRGTSVRVLEEEGLDADGAIESTSKLRSQVLATSGVDILTDTGAYKSTYQILLEIAEVWDQITDDKARAGLLELLAGKRNSSVIAALLQNPEDLKSAYEDAMDAEGSALKENERYLDSIQGKIDQFNNAMQAMWSNTLDSDMVKGFVALGTEIIKTIDNIGLLNSALLAFGAYKGFGALFKSLKADGMTLKSVWNWINQLTLATRAQQVADAAAAGTTLSRTNAEKLLNLSIVKRFATEQIDAKVKEANRIREVSLVAAKQALALAEEQYADGLIDDIALQTAKNAVDAASVPITSSQIGVNTILIATFKGLAASIWGATKAIAAFLFTNPVGWLILAIGAIAGGVAIFNHFHKTTEELTEELSDLKSELSDIRSELDSVNSELETTNERMAELLAMDKLTFEEQEELDKLRATNDELERRKELLEDEEEIKSRTVGRDAAKIVDRVRWEVFNESDNLWRSGMQSGELEIKDQFDDYKKIEEKLNNATTEKDREKYQKELDAKSAIIDTYIVQISDALEGVEYGDSEESDRALDYLAELQDTYAIARGSASAKTNAIKGLFNKDEFAETKTAIDGYVDALAKGDIDAATHIDNIINKNTDLVEDLKARGLEAQDAVDYFTKLGSEANYATIEGKIAEMTEASNRLPGLLSGAFNKDFIGPLTKEQQQFASLFDENGEVLESAIAEYFGGEDGGISDKTQAEIEQLVQKIYDGEISVENALKQFELFGIESTLDIQIKEVQTNFKDVFVDLEDADGLINTFEELGEAIGSTVGALDALNKAQGEMDYSGRVSIQTALELMQYTDNYADVLEVVDGKLQLNKNAEENLINARINAMKVSAQTALADAQAAYEKAKLATQTYNDALTTDMSASVVAKSWEKVLAAGAGLVEGIKSLFTEESWTEAYNRAYNETLSKMTGYETTYNDAGLQALKEAEAEAEQAVKNAQGNVDLLGEINADNIKEMYESDDIEDPEDAAKTKLEEKMEEFQRAMDYWENRIGANQARYEQLQNEIDLLESKGQKADASYYEEQIKLENERKWLLEQQRAEAQKYLKEIEATAGEGSEEWWEIANTLNDIEGELDDVTASIVDLQDAIGEIDTYKFEEFNTRLDNLINKLGTIRDLIAPNEEDWFDDEGNWTEEGVAVLGTYIQELETYKQGLAEAEDAYANYVKEYAGNEKYYSEFGIHSEQELYDKRQELIEQQYDYAQSISDTGQSVVDMYESNIDAIEEYTETLIDSYNDYIDSVKEALQAERDLYDFKKNVQKQSKDIAAIERRIASLSGSTNASDVAERRKLEAELYESRESLNDTYYDHARSAQDEALDAEQTAYEETMTKFIESLRIGLESATANMDEFLMSVTSMVTLNADTVLAKYQETELPLGDAITNPWKEAIAKIGEYDGDALELMNKWTQGGFFDDYKTGVSSDLSSPWTAGSNAADAFKTNVDTVMDDVVKKIETNVVSASTKLSDLYQQILDTEKKAAEAKVDVNTESENENNYDPNNTPKKYYYTTATLKINAKTFSENAVASTKSNAEASAREMIAEQYADYHRGRGVSEEKYESSWLKTHRNKIQYETKYYSKGTTGTSRDEWAITDESWIGEEITLAAGKSGRLRGMMKGSAVLPSDISENLVEWGKVSPDEMGSGNVVNNYVNAPTNDVDVANSLTIDGKSGNTQDVHDSIKDTYELIEDTVRNIDSISQHHKPSVDEALTTPWVDATGKADEFNAAANANYDGIISHIDENKESLAIALNTPYANVTGDINDFSQHAQKNSVDDIITHANEQNPALTTALSAGFNNAKTATDAFKTSGTSAVNAVKDSFTNVKTGLIKALNDTTAAAQKTKQAIDSVPTHSSGGSSSGGSASVEAGQHYISSLGKNVTLSSNVTKWSSVATQALQKTGQYSYDNLLLLLHQMQTESSGNQNAINNWDINAKNGTPSKGLMQVIDPTFQAYAMKGYDKNIYDPLSNIIAAIRYTTSRYGSLSKGWRGSGYAKGTTGTSKDEWAITDEPQFGDELVLVPGKDGNLSFMRKGTGVVPADMTKKLVDLAQIPTSDLMNKNLTAIVPNITKNDFKNEFNFESLVHVDTVDSDTLPKLEKMVDKKIDDFSRALNYSLKKFAR